MLAYLRAMRTEASEQTVAPPSWVTMLSAEVGVWAPAEPTRPVAATANAPPRMASGQDADGEDVLLHDVLP